MNEAIVEKLHGTLSILRRERDEVHRAKELAMERLRLAKEETERMERTLKASQQKYDALMAQSNNSGGSENDGGKGNESTEIKKLKKEVERIGREVSEWQSIRKESFEQVSFSRASSQRIDPKLSIRIYLIIVYYSK